MINQLFRGPLFTYWTYFWPKSPKRLTLYIQIEILGCFILTKVHIWHTEFFSGQGVLETWPFHIYSLTLSDVTSAIQKSIFDPRNMFLAKESSILGFLYILIDSFWCIISHIDVHIWPFELVSGQSVLKMFQTIYNYRLLLMINQLYRGPLLTYWLYLWPKSPRSWTFYTYS